MRTREWRRYKEECIVKKRLRAINCRYWWYFHDVNNVKKQPDWTDFVGMPIQHMYKSYVTKSNDSKYKAKYSPNKGKLWRDHNKKGTREKDRVSFNKMLELEYGIKHNYTYKHGS